MTPLFASLLINRWVELQARGFEFEPAEVQYAPHSRLEVTDDLFVLHAQDLPWQHSLPVGHELDIHPVVRAMSSKL